MTIGEKIANLKGFVEGIKLDESKQENQILVKIIDILNDMSLELEDLNESVDTLNDYAEELDEDLGDVEEYLYDDDDDDDDDDEEFYEVECPNCGEKIYVDEDLDNDEIECPNCNTKFNCDAE